MIAEIVSIGNEILLGEITDTNAAYIASQLPGLGIELQWVSQVGDDKGRLIDTLKCAWQRSDIIITTGGLGPTDDDLTRPSIAEMLGEELSVDPELGRELQKYFANRHIEMPPTNLRQAELIPSARPLLNTQGTAPGWWVEKEGRILITMPGPPREMTSMWQAEVKPRLQKFQKEVILSRTFKTFGLTEASVGEIAFPLFTKSNPTLGVYAKPDGIQLRVFAKGTGEKAVEMLAESETIIRTALGLYIWGKDDDTMQDAVAQLFIRKGLTMAIMEDFTAGWMTSGLTNTKDSDVFLKGGLYASSDQVKTALGIDASLIKTYGAVSTQAAGNMAETAKKLLGADIGVGITGESFKDGAPEGTIYMAMADNNRCDVIRIADRFRRKVHITTTALFELRKWMVGRNG